jgi:transposase
MFIRHEEGESAFEIAKSYGISQQTFYTLKKKFAGKSAAEIREERSDPLP